MQEKRGSAIFSTAYLPPVEYFVYILLSEDIWIEAHETYPKQTYRNRCYIYGSNGIESLNIPVNKPYGNKSKTGEIIISYDQSWQKKHWRAICTAYRKSPFFIYYQDLIEPFYKKPADKLKLLDYNYILIKALLSEIGINKSIQYTDCFEKEKSVVMDFRTFINPKTKHYTIQVSKIYPVYDQIFAYKYGFIANLSILDLLFNKGPDTLKYLAECADKIDTNFLKDMQS